MAMRRALILSLIVLVLLGLPCRVFAGVADTMDTTIQERANSFWFGHLGRLSEVMRTVTVVAQHAQFVPATLDVRRGETIRFLIVNRDAIAHEFVLGDPAEQVAHEQEMAAMPGMPMSDPNGVVVAAGKTASLVWTFTHAGKLQYACHLPGHYRLGMSGWLNVHD
jgi:uncharacterized cupredoxin-like copper-binding protein